MQFRSRIPVIMTTAMIILGFLQAPTIATPPPAVACTTARNWFSSAYQIPSSAVRGASGIVGYQAPILCQNNTTGGSEGPSVSGGWVMVEDDSKGYRRGWAQAGWLKTGKTSGFEGNGNLNGYGTHRFSQWSKDCKVTETSVCQDGEFETVFLYNVQPYARYRARYEQADHMIHIYNDDLQLDTTSTYDPLATGKWSLNWRASYASETWHKESTVAGGASAKAAYAELFYYKLDGSTWWVTGLIHPPSGTTEYPEEYVPQYEFDWYTPVSGGTGFYTWDTRRDSYNP